METKTDSASIVHDLQFFVDRWNELRTIAEITEKALKAEYGVTSLVADEDSYWFLMGGKHYEFGGDDDDLEEEGEQFKDMDAKPWQFMKKELAIWSTLWNEIEKEFDRRGWAFSREDYYHALEKDGWSAELEYYPCDFEEGVNEITYEPDEPGYYWYRPFSEIVFTAVFQIKRDAGLYDFKLSDLEVS